MANQQQLDLLRKGVKAWNTWSSRHIDVTPDLSGATLSRTNLSGAYLSRAILSRTNLSGAFLIDAYLSKADLSGADLSGADLTAAYLSDATLRNAILSKATFRNAILSGADLSGATLSGAILNRTDLHVANLSGADLSGADFSRTDLSGADLSGADLSGADLWGANLYQADLAGADFSKAKIIFTIFGDIDLRTVKGLETIIHIGPSSIGTDTIMRSEGDIPEVFLRGAGLSDSFIIYARSLAQNSIEYHPCFISYSSKDQEFAERLYADLQSNGVRCWFAPEDLEIGDKIRPRIDETIRHYDKLLVVLSEHSIASSWVAYEVEKALNKEPEGTPNVLFPIRLDQAVLTCTTPWAEDIRRTRHIGDFEQWKEHDAYQKSLRRLLRAMKSSKPKREEK